MLKELFTQKYKLRGRQPSSPPRGRIKDPPNRMGETEKSGIAMDHDIKILRKCSCGWSKATTQQGLHIYQEEYWGRIHLQACAAFASETRSTGRSVEHHSALKSTFARWQQRGVAGSAFPQEV